MSRQFQRLIILSSGCAVLLAALFFFRHPLLSPSINTYLVEQIKIHSGVDISIGEIGGTYLSGLELVEVRTEGGAPTTPLTEVNIGRIHIRYSLLSFLAGSDAFQSSFRITLDNAFFKLDLTKNDEQGTGLLLPRQLPELVARNTSIHVRTAGEILQLNGLTAKVEGFQAKTNSQEASLNIEQAILPFPGLPDPHAIDLHLLYTRKSIVVQALLLDRKSVFRTAQLDLQDIDQGRMSFTSEMLLFDGKIGLQGRMDKSLLTGQLTVQDINLDAFPGFLQKPLLEIGGLVNGRIDISHDFTNIADLTGSLNLQVQDGRLQEFAVPQLDIQATVAEGYIRLQESHARSEKTHLTLHDAGVGVSAFLTGKADTIIKEFFGSFSIQSNDFGRNLIAAGLLSSEQKNLIPPLSLNATGSMKNGYCMLEVDARTGNLGNSSLKLEEVSFSLADVFLSNTPYQWVASSRGNFLLKAQNIQVWTALFGNTMKLPEPAELPDHTLTLAGRLQGGTLSLAHGTLNSNDMAITLHKTVITLPDPDMPLETIAVGSELDMQISDLSQFTAIFGLEPAHGSLHGRVMLDGPLADLNGSLHLDGSDIQFSTFRIASLYGRATAQAGEIIIDKFIAQTDEDRLSGQGSFNITEQRINNLALQVSIKKLESYLAGLVQQNQSIQGKLAAEFEASGPWSGPKVKLQARLTEGRYRDVDLQEANLLLVHSGQYTDIQEAHLSTSEGSMALNGNFFRLDEGQEYVFRINTLAMERNEAKLSLTQPVEISFVGLETISFDKLIMAGNIGRIEAGGLLQLTGDSELDFQFVGLTGNGWFSSLVGDRLYFHGADFTCKLTGNLKSPIITLQGIVAELGNRALANHFTGTFDLVIDQRGVDFRKFQWTGQQGQNMMSLNGRLPLNPLAFKMLADEKVDLTARLKLPDLTLVSTMLPPEYAATGSIQSELSLHGTLDMPNIRLQLAAARVILPPAIKYLPPGPFDLNCDLIAEPDRYSFTAFRLTAPSLSLEAAGDWFAPLSLKEIITAPQFPRLTGMLDMKARLAVSDFSWTAKHIEAIRRLDGRFDMEAALTGPAGKPALSGTIRLADGELRSSYEIPSIQNIQLAVAFDADRIDISGLTGELGGAPFAVTGTVRDYATANPVIDLVFHGENLLLHRSDGMNIRSDGNLIFRGELHRLSINGDLAISDGRFSKKFDFLRSVTESTKPQRSQRLQIFSFKEPPLSQASLAVKVRTKKGFLIKNNLAQGFIRPDLLLSGTGELPVIQGTVYLDPIKIKLPSGLLTIESGFVRFTETEPDRPQVDMTGSATIMGYEITVLVNGSIDEPVVTLSSSPPLPDDELLLLVMTGAPPKSDTGSLQKSTMNVAVYLGRSVLDDWFKSNGSESDDSILDRFELEIGRGITRRGEETVDARFRLAENVLRDGDVLFITGQKDAFDYINAGLKIVFRFQ